MAPLRIAHVVEATTGGVARHVMDLVTHLDPSAFTCLLYLSFDRPDAWKAQLTALTSRDIIMREIPMACVPSPRAVRRIIDWAQQDEIDLLHLHSAKAGYHGRVAVKTLQLPVIYTPHAFPFQRTTDLRRPLYRRFERRLAERTSKIICVSEGERHEALTAGLPLEKLAVIPNALDLAQWPLPTREQRGEIRREFGIAEEEIILGVLARLVPQKGIDLLLKAVEEVLPDFPQARVLIWGDGPQRRALERLARQLDLRRVTFLGPTSDPWRAYAAMDLFCAPSRWEGGPYAILEAMACGLPVAATAVAGHTDYLRDGVTGRLAAPDIPGQFAGALRGLLFDADIRHAYGRAARLRVQQDFTLEEMVRETALLYRTVSAEGGKRPG